MNTNNVCWAMVSVVTSIRYQKSRWGKYKKIHSCPVKYEMLYQCSKKFKSLENKHEYSFETYNLNVGDQFVDTRYPMLSFEEYMKKMGQVSIEKHCSKKKILTLCHIRNEVIKNEKSI